MRPEPRDVVSVLVWERGAGETAASGSSAVAVAAVAVARGWSDSPVRVAMPGGELVVTIEGGDATLDGPGGAGLRRRDVALTALDGDLELAQHVVERAQVGRRLRPPTISAQATGTCPAGNSFWRMPGSTTVRGGTSPRYSTGSGPGDVDDRDRRRQETFGAITAPAPIRTPSTISASR